MVELVGWNASAASFARTAAGSIASSLIAAASAGFIGQGAVGSTSLSLPPDGNGAARTERELAVDTRTYASIYPELRTSLPTATPRRGLLFVALGLEYSFIEVPVQPHLNLCFDASGSGLLSDF